jgi:hypothetical protein
MQKKSPHQNEVFKGMFDIRLYGRNFFIISVPWLILGFLLLSAIPWQMDKKFLLIYIPTYIVLILVAGLLSKNFKKVFKTMNYYVSIIFLVASVLSFNALFTFHLENTLIGNIQFLLIFILSYIALVVAIIYITVLGQRVSLRMSIPFKDDFFDKQKKEWEFQIKNFPNFEEILSNLDGGLFITELFDEGLFNLVVLWSCNIIEEIIDSTVNVIISKIPEKTALFRKESDTRINYPLQLKNLAIYLKREGLVPMAVRRERRKCSNSETP